MIAWLNGRVQELHEDAVVVDVQGVGYLVTMTGSDLARLNVGHDVELLIHTIVREDAFMLYGFTTSSTKDMFVALLSVSGVGPRHALALLSALGAVEVARAIHDEKPRVLTAAKGIGKRTAELIIVRLRDKLSPDLVSGVEPRASDLPPDVTAAMRDVRSALVNLGYRASIADAAVRDAAATAASDDFAQMLRSALTSLRRP